MCVGHKTTIVVFTCVHAVSTCVCDIAMCVRDMLSWSSIPVPSTVLKTRVFLPTQLCTDITTLFTVVKEKRQMVLVPCFVHFDLIIDFVLPVVIDGHLAWSYGRFSHTVSKISC